MYYFFYVVNNNIRWIMNKKEYKKIVEKNIEKESPTKNVLMVDLLDYLLNL